MNLRFLKYLLVIFVLCSNKSYAQTETDRKLYRTFIEEKMELWGAIITDFESMNKVETESEKLKLVNYYYGYIGYLLGKKRENVAELYLKKGEQILDHIIEMNPRCAAAFAYRSAFSGWRIGLDHSKAPILGPRFLYCNSHAYALDSLDIQANIDRGNFFFYAPRFIGGDAEKAVCLYHKATTLMEARGMDKNNWQYFNTLILEAKANDKAGNLNDARKIYLRILHIEPGFGWVKNRLLPELNEKIDNI